MASNNNNNNNKQQTYDESSHILKAKPASGQQAVSTVSSLARRASPVEGETN